MAFKQEVNVPLIVTIGAVGGILILVIFYGVEAWLGNEEQAQSQRMADEMPNKWLSDLTKPQKDKLAAAPHWVDPKYHEVAIPVKQAMQIMVQMNGKLPSTMPSNPPARPGGT